MSASTMPCLATQLSGAKSSILAIINHRQLTTWFNKHTVRKILIRS